MALGDRRGGEAGETVAAKQPWEPMELVYVGYVGEIVQAGGGKKASVGGDPGDPRKQKGMGSA